mgnify:FL=1
MTDDRCRTCDKPHDTACQPADWRALALAAERAALAAMRAGDRLTFGDGALIRIDQITDGRVYFVRWSPGSEVGAPTQMDAATVSYEIIERGPVTWRRCDDTDTDGGTAP